jgi:pimeloyl-ACP methyl ester carboxylesterase
MPALSGFRVLRYDLAGHGASAHRSFRPSSLGALSNQLLVLLDHLGAGRAHLAGFSIGGMINRRFALDHPRRVASLVILNSPHDRGAGQGAVEERAKTVRQQGAMATLEAALQRWFTPAYLGNIETTDVVRGWRAEADPESYANAAWVLAHGVRELIAPDPPISTPTLVMTCEADSGSTPEMSRAIAAEIAGAQLHIVPRLKHLGLMEAPEAFADPIRAFLERQPR